MSKNKRSVIHVVAGGQGWNVKREGNDRASSSHQTKESAVDKARRVANEERPSQVKIHGRDGRIQSERTYGNDPEKYKG